jgi:hypothetical protein
MRKIVIAGSSKFYKEANQLKKELENNNYNVIDCVKCIDHNNHISYKEAYETFYDSLSKTDDLILLNLDKNGIEGYIGYESFAELSYLVVKKIQSNDNHKIYIYKMPSESVGCYDEIVQFLELGYIEIYKPMTRPELNTNLDSNLFLNYYYLKEELVNFCKKNNLQATGSKEELTKRIYTFLSTGEKTTCKRDTRRTKIIEDISLNSIIEDNFVCSEVHRAFYKKEIGNSFSFNVIFQKWLKNNAGKTYKDSIDAYYKILEEKKNKKTVIDKQFEYNTYIRDFFNKNNDMSLDDAIKCWNHKKSLPGDNKYDDNDLIVLV